MRQENVISGNSRLSAIWGLTYLSICELTFLSALSLSSTSRPAASVMGSPVPSLSAIPVSHHVRALVELLHPYFNLSFLFHYPPLICHEYRGNDAYKAESSTIRRKDGSKVDPIAILPPDNVLCKGLHLLYCPPSMPLYNREVLPDTELQVRSESSKSTVGQHSTLSCRSKK